MKTETDKQIINRLGSKYPNIVQLGRDLGSYDYYIANELWKANADGAPTNATSYNEETKTWNIKAQPIEDDSFDEGGPYYDEIEEITIKMTDLANELEHYGEYDIAESTLDNIEQLCEESMLNPPDEAKKLREIINKRKAK